MTISNAASIRDALRSAVLQSMKERDRDALAVYRTALAAIDNAEAIPVDEPQQAAGPIELSPTGPGRTDAPRRALTEGDMVEIVRQEVHERRTAAAALAGAEPTAAQRLCREADLLESLVDPAGEEARI